MREAPVLDPAPPRTPVTVQERLAMEVGILARRLADALEQVPSVGSRLSGGLDFLHSLATAPPSDRPRWARGETVPERRPPGPAHPLDRLVDAFGLQALDAELVLLAGLPEEHEGLASVLSTLHPAGEPYATPGLAALALGSPVGDRPELRRALVEGPTRRHRVLRVGRDGPFFNRTLSVAEGLWSALHGVERLPETMEPLSVPEAATGLEEWLSAPEASRAVAAVETGEPWLIHLAADRWEEGVHRATALVRRAEADPLSVRPSPGGRADAVRLAVLHARVRGAVPVVAVPRPKGGGRHPTTGLRNAPGPVILCARHGTLELPAGRPVLEVRCEPLSLSARGRLWAGVLPELAEEAAVLASSYTADPVTVTATARDARARAALDGGTVRTEDVTDSLRTRAAGGGVEGVTIRRPTAGWDELVLPADRIAQLREALGRVRHQKTVLDDWGFLAGRPGARGVRMLLSGPPGTGKSLSAEVLAGALGVDLLAADVSRLVSKWIGETEKNLARVFDAAERAQAVLLFDEADALFARRTEVADSTSRYANLETAYLLTRLERYEGLAILSTNLRRNIDQAFLRRLEFVVEYEEPDTEDRLALWRCHLPAGAPLADGLALEEVASLYPLVGGHIRNAAVAAGFLAAEEGTAITRNCLIRAVRREYAKAGRAFPGPPPDMA